MGSSSRRTQGALSADQPVKRIGTSTWTYPFASVDTQKALKSAVGLLSWATVTVIAKAPVPSEGWLASEAVAWVGASSVTCTSAPGAHPLPVTV
jgi:hypothetical protein